MSGKTTTQVSMRSGGVISRIIVLFLLLAGSSGAMDVVDALSPYNRTRPVRQHTRYIVLHTTEAHERSSLNKLKQNGEANYLVGTKGKVYRLVDSKRIAKHAGVSLWDGHFGMDNWSIGIEVVGYHNREITAAQYKALRELLTYLQCRYDIPDERVLTHSMVAYGEPNRWHKRAHRGRKRCGMLFARERVRTQLGLTAKPSFDPDVRAGRLVVADEQLALVLYGSAPHSEKEYRQLTKSGRDVITRQSTPWDVAGAEYNKSGTLYIFPNGREIRGSEIRDWTSIPVGTKVVFQSAQSAPAAQPVASAPVTVTPQEPTPVVRLSPPPLPPVQARVPGEERVKYIGVDGKDARQVAGERYREPETLYLLPDGRIRRGHEMQDEELDGLGENTAVLVGYTCMGHISTQRNAHQLCADRWNKPDTYYRLADGRLVAGHELEQAELPRNTLVFCRN